MAALGHPAAEWVTTELIHLFPTPAFVGQAHPGADAQSDCHSCLFIAELEAQVAVGDRLQPVTSAW